MNKADPELLKAIQEAIKEVAITQNTVGEFAVNGAAYIVVSVTMFLIFFGIVFYMTKTMTKSQIQQQEQQRLMFEKIMNNDTNKEILGTMVLIKEVMRETTSYLKKVSKEVDETMKIECNAAQIHILFKTILKAADFEIFRKINAVMVNNHIIDRVRIEKRVKSIVDVEYDGIFNSLMSFKYQNKRLNSFLINDYNKDKVEHLLTYIYSEEDTLKRRSTLYEHFDTIFNDNYNKIKIKIENIKES
jgi:hypothetical protein